MDRMLRYQLEQIAKRLRSQVFAWFLIAFWAIMLGALLAISNRGIGGLKIGYPRGLLFAFSFAGVVTLYLWTRFGYRHLNQIAKRIEERFPDLDQKLQTAIEAPKPNESEFLRGKLVQETLNHAKSHSWDQIVPAGRLTCLWALQWLLLIGTLAGALWIRSGPGGDSKSIATTSENLQDWKIEPGNTQIEKGTDLLVSVRFPEGFSEEMQLIARGDNGEIQKVPLQRSFKDPIASATLRRVKQSLKYSIESATKSSEPFAVDVFEHPSVLKSDALIQSPSFARQEDRTVANTRRVSVVDGASILWTLKLNKPVATAEWIDEEGQTQRLSPRLDDPTEYQIPSVPKASGRYRFKLTDEQGRSEKISEEFIVKVIPNREPELKLTTASDQRVSPIQEVLVGAKVQDDFGIHRAGISVSVGDAQPIDIELSTPTDATKKKAELEHLIDLESMSAKADQLVTYHFWTEDLDRDGQPRRVDSEMFFAEIRPFEELFRQGDASATEQRERQQQQQNSQGGQQAEELAELQKKIIAATWNLIRNSTAQKSAPGNDLSNDVSVIRESQEKALAQSQQLKDSLQGPDAERDLLKVQSNMRDATSELNRIGSNPTSIGLRDAIKPMRAAYEGLLRLRAREHEITQNQQQNSNQQQQSSSQRNRQQQIQQLQLEQDPNRYEEESKPMQEESQAEKEMRQVMSRLDELARRQEDLNQQIRELDLALKEAEQEQEKQELHERLDRLREEQQDLVQDADELIERMNNPETRNALEESRQQIENAREQMQQSQQQLEKSEPSAALNSGTRAQQNVEQTRQKLREQSSDALKRDVQDLVKQAQQVADKQSALENQLREQAGVEPKDAVGNAKPTEGDDQRRDSLLRSDSELTQAPDAQKQYLDEWKSQRQEFLELLDRIKETVEQAEGSEPLLAEQLYETYRDAIRQATQQRLERIPMMIERGMEQPAVQESQEASAELQTLRDRIQQSSQSVLGTEEESLRRAAQELERAAREIQEELSNRDPSQVQPNAGDENPRGNPTGEREQANGPEGQGRQPQDQGERPQEQGEQPQGHGEQNQSQGERPQEQREGPQGQGQQRQGQAMQPGQGRRSSGGGEPRSVLEQLDQRMERSREGGANPQSAPLTGEDYVQWTDRLRDIEELIEDPELKAQATRVREAAREFRMEYKRHSKEPQWDLVKKMISNPLQELQRRVREELVRKTAKQNELVPLDRDPVPEKYRSELDRYFERLGGEQSK